MFSLFSLRNNSVFLLLILTNAQLHTESFSTSIPLKNLKINKSYQHDSSRNHAVDIKYNHGTFHLELTDGIQFNSLGTYMVGNDSPCECTQRWKKGSHWNGDGSINDSPTAPDALGIVACTNTVNTQTNIGSGSCTYDAGSFNIDLSQLSCFSPSTGNAVAVSSPGQGCNIIWLNFDVRALAGTYDFQVETNENIGWALYYSLNPTNGVSGPDSLSGNCANLKLYACGNQFNNSWLTKATPVFSKTSNLYLAIWDQSNCNPVNFSVNFKARLGCGNADACLIYVDSTKAICNVINTYTVTSYLSGINGTFTITDNTGLASSISTNPNPLKFTNIADPIPVVNGVVSLVYPIGSNYNFTISAGGSCTKTVSGTSPVLTVICPQAPSVIYSCRPDVPDAINNESGFVGIGGYISSYCGALNFSNTDSWNVGAGCAFDTSRLTRTYKIKAGTDSTFCVLNYKVVDTTRPLIFCPVNSTINCDASTAPGSTGIPTGTDNCNPILASILFHELYTDGSCANNKTLTRTWTATDLCGNTSTCNQVITIKDTTRPVLTCPANINVGCSLLIPSVNLNSVIPSDNCAGMFTISFLKDSIYNQSCANRYNVARFYQAQDICGNTNFCIQTIVVNDQSGPDVNCPSTSVISCSKDVPSILDSKNAVITNDACGGAVLVEHMNDFLTGQTCLNRFSIFRSFKTTDLCGNTSTCTQAIIVADYVAPILTCPTNVTVSCSGNIPPANVNAPFAFDFCTNPVRVNHIGDQITNQTGENKYTTLRTYRATDTCGNFVECTQQIFVLDDVPPNIICPIDLTVNCAELVPPPGPNLLLRSDNCSATVTVLFLSDVVSNYINPNNYIITRTYRATDGSNNSITCSQQIAVRDLIPPTITCPGDVKLNCAGDVPMADIGNVIAKDNCDGQVDISFNGDIISNQICPNRFSISRTYRVSDLSGNTQICVQTLTVNDLTLPSINCPGNFTVSCASEVPPANAMAIVATDGCGGNVAVIHHKDSIVDFICVNRYLIHRIYKAIDACGNEAFCTQFITVEDLTGPGIVCPPPLTINCESSFDTGQTGIPQTTDHCGGQFVRLNHSDSRVDGTCIYNYEIQRSWTATDLCNNSSTCVQTITVQDTSKPVFLPPVDITISCTQNYNDLNITGSASIIFNNCGWPKIDYDDLIDLTGCNGSGTIIRTWLVTDDCGNTSTANQIITVRCPKFDLALKKTLPMANGTKFGDTITFKITVVNQGCDTAYQVLVTDYMSPGYSFLPALNPSWFINGTLMQTLIAGPIIPEDSAFVLIKFKINPLAVTGALSWLNIAEISDAKGFHSSLVKDIDSDYDTIPGNDSGGIPFSPFDDFLGGNGLDDADASDIALPLIQDLALRKTITNGGPYVYGDLINFKLAVFNQGNIPVSNIVVRDYFPNGFEFDPMLNSSWSKLNDSVLSYTIFNTILPNDSFCIFVNLKYVNPVVRKSDSWLNYAEVFSAEGFQGMNVIDADSNLGSDSPKERSVFQNSADNNNILGHFKLDNTDEDDHDVEGFDIVARIGDFVWRDLNDNGLQDPMEPGMPNVIVCLYNVQGSLIAKDTTDAFGYYEFTNLNPGQYFIFVQLGTAAANYYFGKRMIGSNRKIDSDVGSSGVSQSVQINSGTNYDSLDVAIVPFLSLGGFIWEDKNGNGVQEVLELGIKNVQVLLFDAVTKAQLKTTLTDMNGRYLFTKLKSGSYFVKVSPPVNFKFTLANVDSDLTDSDIDHSNGLNSSSSLILSMGLANPNLDGGLYQCASISGTVWNDVNYNSVYNSSERGINGLIVRLYNNQNQNLYAAQLTGPKPGTPSYDGYYSFDCVPPGSYFIRFEYPAGYSFGSPFLTNDPLYDSDVTHLHGIGTTNNLNLMSGTSIKGINAAESKIPTGITLKKNEDSNKTTNKFEFAEISNQPLESENDEQNVKSLDIFPVPASNELFINLKGLDAFPTVLKFYDFQGNLVKEFLVTSSEECQQAVKVDIYSFATGHYRLILKSGETVLMKDFVVIR